MSSSDSDSDSGGNILKNSINLVACRSSETSDRTSAADDQKPSTSRGSDPSSNNSFRYKDDRSSQATRGLKRKTTDDDDLDRNSRKQRAASSNVPQRHSHLDDALVAGSRATISGGQSPLSGSDKRINKLPRLDEERPYAMSGLKRSLHGNIYQLKHLMLILHRAWKMGYAFRLSTEVDAAEKFDDLVLHYRDNAGNEVHRFLQVKHKQDETKTIGVRQLLDMKDGDFSLLKYFVSWRKIKKHSEFRGSRTKIFILCTNIGLDVNGFKTKKINVNEVEEPDEFLKVTDRAEQPPRYRLQVEKSSELHDTLKKASDVHILGREIAERVYSSEKIHLNNEIIKRYHAALAKEIINTTSKRFFPNFIQNNNLSENAEKFRESLISHTSKLWGGKTSEDKIWKVLEKTELQLSATFGKKTGTKEDLSSKLALPNDDIDDLEISNFLNEFILAVKQPNEIELGEMIRREIGADSQFNLLDAGFITDSFQTTVLDWFKGEQGGFLKNKDAEDFFNDIEVKLGSLITLTLSLEYSEKLKEHDIEFNCKHTELQDFINSPNHASPQMLELISSGQTLLTALRVYQTLTQWQKREKNKTFILIRLKTLLRQGIMEKVLRAFQWPHNHNLLVVDCESSNAKQHLQKLWKPLCKIMAKNVHKRMIVITQRLEDLGTRFKLSHQTCHVKIDDHGFGNLTNDSQSQLLRKQVTKFQGQKIETSFGKLLGILNFDNLRDDELKDLSEMIDSDTLVGLICRDEIQVGCNLKRLDEIQDYYINRTIFQRVVIKEDILEDQEIPDLLAVSGMEREFPGKLTRLGGTSWKSRNPITDLFTASSSDTDLRCETMQIEQTSAITHSSTKCIILDVTKAEEQFKALCGQDRHRNIHWLKMESGKYIWEKSQGDINYLFKYRDITESSNLNDRTGATDLSETQLADHDEPVIISDVAGMGKSVLLTHLACEMKQNNPNMLVLKIDLNHHPTALAEVREKSSYDLGSINGAVKFLVEKLLSDETNFAKKIFKRIIDERLEVALIFDGFDEISPTYEDTVIDLLQTIKNFGIEKLCVATRPHTRGALESKLNAFSYEMQPLSTDNQKDFLTKYWITSLGLQDESERIRTYAEVIMKKLAHSIKDQTNKFAGIPLQTRLVAEIFECHSDGEREHFDSCKEFVDSKVNQPKFPEKINLIYLYKHFVEKKFDNYFSKRDGDLKNVAVMEEKRHLHHAFIDTHEELALYALFDEEKVKKLLHEKVARRERSYGHMVEERTGIITEFIDGKPHFGHRTYAEYFAAKFFSDKLKRRDHNELFREMFVTDVLLAENYETLRAFLNFLLSEAHIDVLEAQTWKFHLNKHRSKFNETIFHVAAAEGNRHMIRLFLNCLATSPDDRKTLINIEDSSGKTAVHRAVEYGQLKGIKLLVEQTSYEINSRNTRGETPLFLAAGNGRLDIVKYLLDKGADVNSQANNGLAPLHPAAFTGELDVVKYLLDKGANVDPQEINSLTPLYLAVGRGELEVVKHLLDKGANYNSLDNNGLMPLHLAAQEGNLDVIKYLLRKGAMVDSHGNNDLTPLHEAAQSGKLNVVKYLLRKGANINAQGNLGSTPLHLAIGNGKLDVVKYLLRKGANVNSPGNNGMTPLHLATYKGELDIVKCLLDKEANINSQANNGMTPLHLAAHKDRLNVVKYLIDRRANINSQANNGVTPLHSAAQEGKLDTIRYLLNQGANVNSQENAGTTPLHLAAQEGKLDVVKYLLDNGANVNSGANNGVTPLYLVAYGGELDIVKYLIDEGANVNLQENNGATPLHVAAQQGKLDVVNYLLENGANVNFQANNDSTPLFVAAGKGELDVVKCLLDNGADVDIPGSNSWTPLHLAAHKGEFNIVKYLLDNGADSNSEGNDGLTPLHLAAYEGKVNVVKCLLDKGADVNSPGVNGMTPLHMAAHEGKLDIVKPLLESRANINSLDNNGLTPLYLALQEGKWDVVRYLFGKRGTINYQNGND